MLIRGKAVAVSSNGSFKTVVPAPNDPGEYTLNAEAAHAGRVRRVQVGFEVRALKPRNLKLELITPIEGLRIDRPRIRVAGKVTPGASVEAGGVRIPVDAAGAFASEIPIPDEEGNVTLELEATLGDMSVVQTRAVEYRRPEEPLAIEIQSPAGGLEVCRTIVTVGGRIRPVDAEVSVNGTMMAVRNGSFRGEVMISADPGEHDIVFEVSADDKSLSATRTIRFEPAGKRCNTDPPDLRGRLPVLASQRTLWFTVYDKTIGDEITFYREIDGSRDSETGRPNARFRLDLEEGEHSYSVYAEDAAGNRSAVRSATVRYLPASTPVTIRRRRPASARTTLGVPPGRPTAEGDLPFKPSYAVEFSVENLPDDDPSFLKEVVISNDHVGWSDRAGLIDVDFDFDVPLRRGGNHIVVEVRDINNRVIRDEFDIIVR
ncbi:MAG: hypothetical protein GF344_19995 [Chitinivibrionales bacterium]|nr:hypothetical protein [Chitinivibrionales bacterium]MBD3358896.1 hypothetical protein [Chitinivibrionales bacterium]